MVSPDEKKSTSELAMARNGWVLFGKVNDGKQAKSTVNIFSSFVFWCFLFFSFFCYEQNEQVEDVGCDGLVMKG